MQGGVGWGGLGGLEDRRVGLRSKVHTRERGGGGEEVGGANELDVGGNHSNICVSKEQMYRAIVKDCEVLAEHDWSKPGWK